VSAAISRRAALTGAASGAAVMAVAGLAVAATTPAGGISPDLAALIAVAKRIEAEANSFDKLVCLPLNKRVEAAVAALPHTTVDAGPSVSGGRVNWSTANPTSVVVTRSIVEMGKEGKDMGAAGLKQARTIQAAHIRRERAADRIHRNSSYIEANNRSDAYGAQSADAADKVAVFLVTNAADLHAKIAFMVEREMFDGMDWSDELLADAAHLAKMEG
jgi:hypothetical protein